MLDHIRSTDGNQQGVGAKGFTLIELLVVIVILGILGAVVVFAVNGVNDDSEAKACQIEGRTVATAVESYQAQEGKYPADMDALTTEKNFLEGPPEYWALAGDVATSGDITRINLEAVGTDDGDCPERT